LFLLFSPLPTPFDNSQKLSIHILTPRLDWMFKWPCWHWYPPKLRGIEIFLSLPSLRITTVMYDYKVSYYTIGHWES
jgi:hypothetical protein